MEITAERKRVTSEMMEAANMTRGSQLGLPVDPMDKNKGLVWKDLFLMTDEDFDKIEEYFIQKDNQDA